jgi:hypothetical protein
MTLTDALRVGAYGFTIEGDLLLDGVPADISGATLLQIRFERPDGSTFTRTAQIASNGLDGKVAYLVQANDLNQAGDWRYQFTVNTPQLGFPFQPVAFRVEWNIP